MLNSTEAAGSLKKYNEYPEGYSCGPRYRCIKTKCCVEFAVGNR